MRQTSGTARTAASTLTGKNPSPRKIRKVWPAPMANAFSRARARAASSLPHQRLVEVFHGLDEMRLAEDEVDGVRLDDGHHGEFHGCAPAGWATQSMVGGWKVIASRHRRPISPLADRRFCTFETYRRILRMSANRGRLEVADNRQNDANDPDRTLRAPRPELWYPPSNAMGRFNEAADPQMALAARAERPRVLAGLHDSTKWPGIPTS